jgi:Tol biopolymer transport system component
MVVSASGAPRRLTAAGEKSAWPAVSAKGDRLVFSRALSDNNIWRVPLHSDTVAGAPEKFVSSTRDEGIPQYSPDGRKIVFTSDRSGVLEVWVCDADGSSPVQLTSLGVGMTGSPHWSPDGKQIVFDSNASGHFEVYVVRAAGGSPRRLTTDPAGSGVASFSRDGRQIYFASRRSGSEKVWKMPAEGGEPIQVTRGVGTGPSVSPDGTLIYYQKAGQLWSVPVTGGQGVKVLDSVAFLNYAVTERGIYFIPVCGGARCASIQFFDLATRTTTPVVATGESLEVGLTVSPDRKFLLYTQVDQSGSDLMLVENFR